LAEGLADDLRDDLADDLTEDLAEDLVDGLGRAGLVTDVSAFFFAGSTFLTFTGRLVESVLRAARFII
jgi:hypothetical protein